MALTGAAWGAPALAQACHGAPSGVRLFIDVQGVRSNAGFVVANLYGPDKHKWLADNGWLGVWRDPSKPGTETLCLYLPAPGSYALVMFQDANADGDLNLGPFGPTEGYGFSNNVRPFLLPPSLKSALFSAGPGDTRLQIRLHYP
ncbi:MAG TPA: DUF2141 domain-containing protein [Caulobacteraceae bacterium]|nr:DUF2141 domain-containing protein [Caulobacteraceae bacterium]